MVSLLWMKPLGVIVLCAISNHNCFTVLYAAYGYGSSSESYDSFGILRNTTDYDISHNDDDSEDFSVPNWVI